MRFGRRDSDYGYGNGSHNLRGSDQRTRRGYSDNGRREQRYRDDRWSERREADRRFEEDNYDDFGETTTGRLADRIASGGKKKEKPAVTCNNLQFEVCEKHGIYYNMRTWEQINVE